MKTKKSGRTVACVIFYDETGRILLQDRRAISKAGEEWGFFGGGVKKGETPLDAARREIQEELGLNLMEPVFLGEFTNEIFPGYVLKRHVFLSPLPTGFSRDKVTEGNAELFMIAETNDLIMPLGDHSAIEAAHTWLIQTQ